MSDHLPNRPKAKADTLQLRCFEVSQPMLRNWLFQNGHEAAAAALSGVEYVDLEQAWDELAARSSARTISEEEGGRWLKAVADGNPQGVGSILPRMALRP